jgi:flagellar motor switch protein FliM
MREAQAVDEGSGETALLHRAEVVSGEIGAGAKLQIERIGGLPVQVDVRVPLPDFRVKDLLALAAGKVVPSEWPGSEDIPLSCGDVHLVWTEFEVVDQRLAVRVTRLV